MAKKKTPIAPFGRAAYLAYLAKAKRVKTKVKAKPKTKVKAKPKTKVKAKPKAKVKAKPKAKVKVKPIPLYKQFGLPSSKEAAIQKELARQHRVDAAVKHQDGLRARNAVLWAQLAKKLPKFKKSDIGKIIYVALPTKAEINRGVKFVLQSISGRRKSFVFFVDAKGRAMPMKEKGAPQYGRPQTVKVLGVAPKYVIKKSYTPQFTSLYSIKNVKTGIVTERYPCLDGKNLKWDAVVADITKELKRFMYYEFPNSDINFTVTIRDVRLTEVSTGEKHQVTDYLGVDFKSRAMQEYKKGGLENYVSKKMYAHFAEKLSENELVTTGSSAYIWKFANSESDYDDREDWSDERGQPWEKWDFKDVFLTHFCYDISNMRITT